MGNSSGGTEVDRVVQPNNGPGREETKLKKLGNLLRKGENAVKKAGKKTREKLVSVKNGICYRDQYTFNNLYKMAVSKGADGLDGLTNQSNNNHWKVSISKDAQEVSGIDTHTDMQNVKYKNRAALSLDSWKVSPEQVRFLANNDSNLRYPKGSLGSMEIDLRDFGDQIRNRCKSFIKYKDNSTIDTSEENLPDVYCVPTRKNGNPTGQYKIVLSICTSRDGKEGFDREYVVWQLKSIFKELGIEHEGRVMTNFVGKLEEDWKKERKQEHSAVKKENNVKLEDAHEIGGRVQKTPKTFNSQNDLNNPNNINPSL